MMILSTSSTSRLPFAAQRTILSNSLRSATITAIPVTAKCAAPRATYSSLATRKGINGWLNHSVWAVALALAIGGYQYTSRPLQLEAAVAPDNATALRNSLPASSSAVRLDPATQQPLPVTLPTPQTTTGCKELTLVGLGVRTVSFLRVRVYVAGLYVDAAALRDLVATPGWRGFEATWMMDNNKDSSHPSSEDLVNALLDRGVACAIRIVPVRSTDYSHLRDGFTRSIQSRAKLARKAGLLSSETDEALSHALQALKEAFPKASLAKGSALDLIFTPSSTPRGLDLTLEESGQILGRVQSLSGSPEAGQYSVARQLLLAYLADKDEISKPFKESVAQGFRDSIRGTLS